MRSGGAERVRVIAPRHRSRTRNTASVVLNVRRVRPGQPTRHRKDEQRAAVVNGHATCAGRGCSSACSTSTSAPISTAAAHKRMLPRSLIRAHSPLSKSVAHTPQRRLLRGSITALKIWRRDLVDTFTPRRIAFGSHRAVSACPVATALPKRRRPAIPPAQVRVSDSGDYTSTWYPFRGSSARSR